MTKLTPAQSRQLEFSLQEIVSICVKRFPHVPIDRLKVVLYEEIRSAAEKPVETDADDLRTRIYCRLAKETA